MISNVSLPVAASATTVPLSASRRNNPRAAMRATAEEYRTGKAPSKCNIRQLFARLYWALSEYDENGRSKEVPINLKYHEDGTIATSTSEIKWGPKYPHDPRSRRGTAEIRRLLAELRDRAQEALSDRGVKSKDDVDEAGHFAQCIDTAADTFHEGVKFLESEDFVNYRRCLAQEPAKWRAAAYHLQGVINSWDHVRRITSGESR